MAAPVRGTGWLWPTRPEYVRCAGSECAVDAPHWMRVMRCAHCGQVVALGGSPTWPRLAVHNEPDDYDCDGAA